MSITEKVIDKLRKLIEHEKSARHIGSVAEAESFAARIQELMFRLLKCHISIRRFSPRYIDLYRIDNSRLIGYSNQSVLQTIRVV